MKFDRVLTVARKDLDEFGKNKYVLGTILFFPLMAAVILPLIYVVPINELGSQRGDPLDLEFDITGELSDITITNSTFFDMRIDRADISNSVLQGCIVTNSTVTGSIVDGTEISNSTVVNSLLTNSNLFYPEENTGNSFVDSQIIGEDSELEQLQDIMFNMLLILLIMIPVTIPTVTASYSFVGEKVNRSLEPLLATPITDTELLLGKAGSIFVLSMAATLVAFAVSIVMVDLLTEPVLGYYPLPTMYWIVGIGLLAPGMCLLSILTNVLVSSKVNDVRVSQQVGGVVVLPLLIFFISSFSGLMSDGMLSLLAFSGLIFATDLVVLWFSLRIFRREEILVSWK